MADHRREQYISTLQELLDQIAKLVRAHPEITIRHLVQKLGRRHCAVLKLLDTETKGILMLRD